MVKFPRAENDESTIRLEGNGAVVEKIIAVIQDFVKEKEDQVVVAVEVPQSQHRLLIGRGGETRRGIESKFNVNLDIPKQGSDRSGVKLRGSTTAAEEAKAYLLDLLQQQKGETINVPRYLHHTVSDNGTFFRRLRNDYRVTVDHAGQQIPTKPTVDDSRGETSLPLITDDPADAETHSWKVITASAPSGEAEPATIPWVLTGNTDNVAKAKSALEKALASATDATTTGYLILPDPKTYRFVVGQGGSQINSIRSQTGCRITVPKGQAKGEAIEIRGSETGVEDAKELIIEAVKAGQK